MYSYSRGTSETRRRTPRSAAPAGAAHRSGAVENATTTWSTPCSSITCSRSQLAPRIGNGRMRIGERLLVEEADRRRPNSGCSSRRFATRWPILPAPMISVGFAASPSRRVTGAATTRARRARHEVHMPRTPTHAATARRHRVRAARAARAARGSVVIASRVAVRIPADRRGSGGGRASRRGRFLYSKTSANAPNATNQRRRLVSGPPGERSAGDDGRRDEHHAVDDQRRSIPTSAATSRYPLGPEALGEPGVRAVHRLRAEREIGPARRGRLGLTIRGAPRFRSLGALSLRSEPPLSSSAVTIAAEDPFRRS